ncbi:MAG TPA: hypothetical protein VJY62_18980 [Bacteroidia bacterium]|nr:hypothetical protein [Bacteroidia bacterium]
MKPNDLNKLKQEHEAYKRLYDSLLDFGQDKKTPVEKLDYVKARIFDAFVSVNRINDKQLLVA